MDILIASDLHFEFQADRGVSFTQSMPAAEILVCAGDLSDAVGIEAALRLLCSKFPHVVFVAGNHEFYQGSIWGVRRKLSELNQEISGLHYLDNDSVEIGEHRFVGTTMWFRKQPDIERLHGGMNDFDMIVGASEVYAENSRALAFLHEEVDDQSIVVTHHLPSSLCVDEKYEGSRLNCFFVCDMDELICEKQPPLWIHGHTHESVDTKLNKTRIVCNPFGYATYEINPNFDEEFFVSG